MEIFPWIEILFHIHVFFFFVERKRREFSCDFSISTSLPRRALRRVKLSREKYLQTHTSDIKQGFYKWANSKRRHSNRQLKPIPWNCLSKLLINSIRSLIPLLRRWIIACRKNVPIFSTLSRYFRKIELNRALKKPRLRLDLFSFFHFLNSLVRSILEKLDNWFDIFEQKGAFPTQFPV